MPKEISLTINGYPVSVPDGTLIVNAAKKFGIDIPVFCYHPKMEPVGMCRQCLVEVGRPMIDRATGQVVLEEGKPKIQFGPKLETACSTQVCEGMVVLTQSEKARASHKEILEFLLTSHPLDCPICDKGGECPLQNLTMEHASPSSRFIFDEKHHAEKHVPLGDKIWLDRERCIQCARCIRFQAEVVGEPVLAFYHRGRATDIISRSTPPFDSIFSGNTTDICPVGALTTADFRFGARPWEMKSAASICGLCPVGCNTTINTRREAKSGGKAVIKRVMPRQNEQVNEIWMCDRGRFNWRYTENDDRLKRPMVRRNDALKTVDWETAIGEAAGKLNEGHGKVVLASGRLSNEDLFLLRKLTEKIDADTLLYDSLPGGELTTTHGMGEGTNLGSLGSGTLIIVTQADLYYHAPIWHLRVKQAADRGARVVVINSKPTRLENHASQVIRCKHGEAAKAVETFANESVSMLAEVENLVVFFGGETTPALPEACAQLLKERQGKRNNGLIGVWPRGNDQGAWEMGFKTRAGLAKALKGKIVYIVGADPVGDDPKFIEALKEARAVIVQDICMTETAKCAHVVLPAQALTEREGTYTNGERRVQRFYPVVNPIGECLPDFKITARIGSRLGLDMQNLSASEVMDSLASSIPAFIGLSYGKLAQVSEQEPIIGRADLYYGGTSYQNLQGLGLQLNLRLEGHKEGLS